MSAPSRTVLAFDSWVQGWPHYERLVEPLERRGLKLILLHIGSWGHEPERLPEEMVGSLLVRDISYYGGAPLDGVLERESPAAVLFLSIQAFAHRAFNRFCLGRGTPTVHLYHGLVSVQDTKSAQVNPVNWVAQPRLVRDRIAKNVQRILPMYARSMAGSGADLADWGWLLKDLGRKAMGRSYGGLGAPDTRTDVVCVYTPADVAHAVRRYRVPEERVHVVGNPDLMAFGLTEAHLASYDSARGAEGNVLYIDTAFIGAGKVYDGAEHFVDHLTTTRDVLVEQGLGFSVKLHPAHSRTGVPDLLRTRGVDIAPQEEFLTALERVAAVIVEPSTAAMLPALMGLPVFLARYGPLGNQNYGSVLTSYPRADMLEELHQIGARLERLARVPSEELAGWVDSNVGPMPASEMPERVANIVAALAASDS